jgi:hypothetical protein
MNSAVVAMARFTETWHVMPYDTIYCLSNGLSCSSSPKGGSSIAAERRNDMLMETERIPGVCQIHPPVSLVSIWEFPPFDAPCERHIHMALTRRHIV